MISRLTSVSQREAAKICKWVTVGKPKERYSQHVYAIGRQNGSQKSQPTAEEALSLGFSLSDEWGTKTLRHKLRNASSQAGSCQRVNNDASIVSSLSSYDLVRLVSTNRTVMLLKSIQGARLPFCRALCSGMILEQALRIVIQRCWKLIQMPRWWQNTTALMQPADRRSDPRLFSKSQSHHVTFADLFSHTRCKVSRHSISMKFNVEIR